MSDEVRSSAVDPQRFDRMVSFVEGLQDEIVRSLEAFEADAGSDVRFRVDDWGRPDPDLSTDNVDKPLLGGGGRTRVLEDGAVFEKAGVNVSRVWGRFSGRFAGTMPGEGRDFRATGISIVIHPRNPYVPTVHMNYRRLERGEGLHVRGESDGIAAGTATSLTGWYGGGADLTPYYLFEDDARHFHRVHQAACDAHPAVADYATMKQACDAYFHLPHRGEARGIGGLFFDYLRDDGGEGGIGLTKESGSTPRADADAAFAFVQDAGRAFMQGYGPIVERRRETPYTDRERDWQLVRRGRYVEFNLVYDRGTVFGLKTGGRIESILMSLPTAVSWRYRVEPEPDSPEATLVDTLKSPRDWV